MSVRELAAARRALRYVGGLGVRSRVALCQLPLVAAVLAVVIAAPAAWGDAAARPLFAAGLLVQVVAGALCLAVPWERLPPNAVLWIPSLDFASIWLLRNGGPEGAFQSLTSLAVFPVIWIAGSALSARVALPLCFAAPLLITLPTLVDTALGRGGPGLGNTLLLPPLMLTVAVAIRAAGAGLRLQERQLRAHQAKLRELLEESTAKEALLATILDAASVGIVAVGPDARPFRWNTKFTELLHEVGVSSPAGFDIADPAFPVFGADRRTPLAPERRPLHRAAEGEVIDAEMVWFGSGARARALQVVARQVAGDSGSAVVSYADVTDLAQTVEDKAELVRTVAHEFRSPLTSVLGNLDLALDSEAIPAAERARLEIAQSSAERLIELARDLMASSEVTLPVRPVRCDLAGLCAARAEAVRAAADAAGVRLAVDLAPPLWARADPLRIGQAVDNLLSNAVKYSPDGGVITLSLSEDQGWASIRVRDTGMGIAPEETEQVFERFFRTDAARESAIPGVGLGLSFTRMVAERHGGRLELDSEPGRGSVFTLALPLGGPA